MFPISGQPVAGSIQQVIVRIIGPFATVSFSFVTTTSVTLQTPDLDPLGDPNTNHGEYIGLVELLTEPFQLAATGNDADGNPYSVIFPKVFGEKTVEVNFDRTPFRLDVGTTQIEASVTNHGQADKFALLVSSNLLLITKMSPSSLTLAQGETGEFIVDVTVPIDMPQNTNIKITAKVSAMSDPSIENKAIFILPTVLLPRIIAPPDITVPPLGDLTPVDIRVAQATQGLVPENNAPDLFPPGITIVTWKVMDDSGNVATAKQTINVGDPLNPNEDLQININSDILKVKKKGKFKIFGTLLTGSNSDGIDPVNEEVTITFGPFSETIPAGSFKLSKNGKKWLYVNKGAKGLTRVRIKKKGDLKIVGKRIDTSNISIFFPVAITVEIGNNSGETEFEFP